MRFPTYVLLIFAIPGTAVADIIIDVQDLTFDAGSSGSVDVNIRSTSTDVVDFYNYRFAVTDVGANVGSLRFVDPQSNAESADPDYLFGFDSFFLTTAAENSPAFDSVIGTDLTLSGLGASIGATDLLFARLEFEHILPGGVDASLAGNDQFLISLVDADTSLLSDAFDPGSLVPFTGNSGTLSASTAAVPEPSSALLMCVCSGALIYRRRKSRPFDRTPKARATA